MKYRCAQILLFFLLIWSGSFLFAQSPLIQIRFEDYQFKLKDINDKSEVINLKNEADIQRFYEHFQVEDYQHYRSFYLDGNCRATEEDFKTWKSFLQGQQVEIVSRFILESSKYVLSIIQYKMGKDGTYIYGPFTLQKINGIWYLLNTEESMDLMEVKGFFANINTEILKGASEPASWSQHPYYHQFVSTGGVVDGKKLFEIYPARYDTDHASYALSNTLFHGVSEVDSQTRTKLTEDFVDLAEHYQINAKTKSLIERMVQEGNYTLALETIFQESNADNIIEVTQKFNQILTEQQ